MAGPSVVRPIPVPEANERFKDVPPDRYGVKNLSTGEYHFFQVFRARSGKWVGWTFLNEITGGNQRPIRWNSEEFTGVMMVINSNPLECLKAYGQKTGTCGKCKKTLTDPVSVKIGVGPDCCEKYGIPRTGGKKKKATAKKTAAKKTTKTRAVKKGGVQK